MSRVTFIEPIADLTGKARNTSNISHRTTFGVRHTYYWNPENVVKPTPARLIHREAMAQANYQASRLLLDEQSASYWRDLYRKSKYAGPINSFIIRALLPDIKSRLRTQLQDLTLADIQSYIAKQRHLRA